MSISRIDVDAVLVLSDILPEASADELIKILEKFRGSEYDQPQYDLYSCLLSYVKSLIFAGLDREG